MGLKFESNWTIGLALVACLSIGYIARVAVDRYGHSVRIGGFGCPAAAEPSGAQITTPSANVSTGRSEPLQLTAPNSESRSPQTSTTGTNINCTPIESPLPTTRTPSASSVDSSQLTPGILPQAVQGIVEGLRESLCFDCTDDDALIASIPLLARQRHRQAEDALVELSAHSNFEIREAVALSVQLPLSQGLLVQMLADEHPAVREAAIEQMEKLQMQYSLPLEFFANELDSRVLVAALEYANKQLSPRDMTNLIGEILQQPDAPPNALRGIIDILESNGLGARAIRVLIEGSVSFAELEPAERETLLGKIGE